MATDGRTHYEGCWKTRGHLDCAELHVAELEAKLAALDWTPISPDNLPKVGDEVRGDARKVLEVEERHIGFFTSNARVWIQSGYTMRRPIHAPLAAPRGSK